MKNKTLLILSAILVLSLWSCGTITREEHDLYAVTQIDTTDTYFAQNAPENRDNGVIYPSSRRFETERRVITKDSLVIREYPDFIRLSVFESVGLFMAGDGDYALGNGMFGLFPDIENIKPSYEGDPDYFFKGGIYRFMTGEWRLHWFQDAADWTWGLSLMEIIAPDALLENTLASVLAPQIKKRWYLKRTIPYVALSSGVSFGWYPSLYMNLNGAIELGSIGGLNLRGYVGLAAGYNPDYASQIKENNRVSEGQSSVFPYAGIGISMLDFVNIVPETEKEWKDYEHSSWDIGLLQMNFLFSGADQSVWTTSEDKLAMSGVNIKLLNATVALPVLDNKLYAGTSLFNLMALGDNQWGIGVLPIRFGYWQTVLADELTTEPFLEFNYYPSSFINIGNRLNLRTGQYMNFSLIIGYASGSATDALSGDIADEIGVPDEWSGAYFGIGFGFLDSIFFPDQLRYNK